MTDQISPERRELIEFALNYPDEKILRSEAATLLGVSAGTLSYWERTGRGPPVMRLSYKWAFYRVGDLLDWLRTETRAGFPKG